MIYPKSIQKGEKIYCISPSAFTPYDRVSNFIALLQQRGFVTELSKHTIHPTTTHYLSATDQQRTQDFQQAINDPSVRAIWCMRGGYGASRIVDDIDFTPLLSDPKWLIGFSDITLFQLHLYSQYHISSLHGCMTSVLVNGRIEDVDTALDMLMGKHSQFCVANQSAHTHHRLGTVRGRLIGGNVSLIVHSLGTPSEPDWNGKILFIEDVGEYWYALERMLIQLKRHGVLDKIAGLVVGKFEEMKDTTPPLGTDLYAMIYRLVERPSLPIGFDFPFGHGKEMYPFVQGAMSELEVNETQAQLTLYLNDF